MNQPRRSRMRSKAFPILLGCFLALIVITVWETASSHAGYSWSSDIDSGAGEVHRIRIREGRWRLLVNFKGDVEMTADERGIARIGPESFIEIEERKHRDRFRLEATPGADGEPEIAWFVNREPAEFDADARDWLEEILPRIYRTTGLDAEARVGRFLAASGMTGVLTEIRRIERDQIQRIYYEQVLEQAESTPEELASLVRHMGRDIGSDYELRQVLASLSPEVLVGEGSANAFVAAAGSIGSDHELRQMLAGFLGHPELEPAAFETLIDASHDIGSDYDLAGLLIDLIEAYPSDHALPRGVAHALKTIGSDYELRKVLAVALQRPEMQAEELDALLVASQSIGSDYDLAELLVEFSKSYGAKLPDSFFRAVGTVGDDFHHSRVLRAATERPDPTVERVEAILRSALDIGSDHEMMQLLVGLARVYPIDDRVRPAFERAAASIGSEHQRKQALAAARSPAPESSPAPEEGPAPASPEQDA